MNEPIDNIMHPKIYFNNFSDKTEIIQEIKQNYINLLNKKEIFTKEYAINFQKESIKISPKVIDKYDEADIIINYVDRDLKDFDYLNSNKKFINICSSLIKNDTLEMLPDYLASIFRPFPNIEREKIIDHAVEEKSDTDPYMPSLNSNHLTPKRLQSAISKVVIIWLQNN